MVFNIWWGLFILYVVSLVVIAFFVLDYKTKELRDKKDD